MPKKEANKDHDWNEIRHDYVISRDTLEVVRKRHGVDHASITRHSSDEAWVEARQAYQRDVADRRLAIVAKRQAKSEAEIDCAVHDAVWSSMTVLTEGLSQAKTPAAARVALHALAEAWRLLRATSGLPKEKTPAPPEEKEFVFHALDSDGQDYFESKGKRYYQLTAMALAAATLGITPEDTGASSEATPPSNESASSDVANEDDPGMPDGGAWNEDDPGMPDGGDGGTHPARRRRAGLP